MYLASIEIHNYKSFHHSAELHFQPGFNIIVGQNNSGKTALLEALSTTITSKPHRSELSLPVPHQLHDFNSWAKVSFVIPGSELAALLDDRDWPPILLLPEAINIPLNRDVFDRLHQTLLSTPEILVNLGIGQDPLFGADVIPAPYATKIGSNLKARLNRSSRNDWEFKNYESTNSSPWSSIASGLQKVFQQRAYRFNAERMNIAMCMFGDSMTLKPDASNLPEALNTMRGRRDHTFRQFNQLVSQVFPHIQFVNVQSRPNSRLEIMVWTCTPSRDDLAISLSECGTGISQVLAILFVVLTSDTPRTILIDEPQSFLHPGATRKLLEILKTFPLHQYFISTHSSDIISITQPQTITLLRYEAGQTQASVMKADDAQHLRQTLDELGVRLSDVFGMDRVLWVEGSTEELSFPIILEALKRRAQAQAGGQASEQAGERMAALEPWSQTGLALRILAVQHTGDLDSQRAQLVFDLYRRLSGGNNLLPPAIGFVFDREGKSQSKIDDIQRQAQGKVHFLARPMYESYLLHPEAIASVANRLPGFQQRPLNGQQVSQWIAAHLSEFAMDKKKPVVNIIDSIGNIHAAKLLDDLFAHFSENTERYQKTRDSVRLTEWLMEHAPEQLQEIQDLLKQILLNRS